MLHLPKAEDVEVLCDYRSSAGPKVTAVRGTLIASPIRTLRELGYFERYLEQLPAESHDAILYTLAMSWVPIELAMTHYAACDAMRLPEPELIRVGHRVATSSAEAFFGTLLRSVRSAGVDAPWLALRAQPRVWDRMYTGGGLTVLRTGPKDAILELHGIPLATYRYFAKAYAGYLKGMADLIVRKFYVSITEPRERSPHSLAFAGSWV